MPAPASHNNGNTTDAPNACTLLSGYPLGVLFSNDICNGAAGNLEPNIEFGARRETNVNLSSFVSECYTTREGHKYDRKHEPEVWLH